MQARSLDLPQSRYEEGCQIWNGRDFLPILRDMGVCAETYPLLKVLYSSSITEFFDNIFRHMLLMLARVVILGMRSKCLNLQVFTKCYNFIV